MCQHWAVEWEAKSTKGQSLGITAARPGPDRTWKSLSLAFWDFTMYIYINMSPIITFSHCQKWKSYGGHWESSWDTYPASWGRILPGKGNLKSWANRLLTINISCQKDRLDMLLQLNHQNRAGWRLGIRRWEFIEITSVINLCWLEMFYVFAVPNFNYRYTLYKCMYTHSSVYAVYI